MKNQYYHSLLCVAAGGGQVVYKIKPQNKNKAFATALARSLLPHFCNVFIVHCEISLLVLQSMVRGRLVAPPKVISVF
jgi:hypothetical protein